jgi:hypothetical protein
MPAKTPKPQICAWFSCEVYCIAVSWLLPSVRHRLKKMIDKDLTIVFNY